MSEIFTQRYTVDPESGSLITAVEEIRSARVETAVAVRGEFIHQQLANIYIRKISFSVK